MEGAGLPEPLASLPIRTVCCSNASRRVLAGTGPHSAEKTCDPEKRRAGLCKNTLPGDLSELGWPSWGGGSSISSMGLKPVLTWHQWDAVNRFLPAVRKERKKGDPSSATCLCWGLRVPTPETATQIQHGIDGKFLMDLMLVVRWLGWVYQLSPRNEPRQESGVPDLAALRKGLTQANSEVPPRP